MSTNLTDNIRVKSKHEFRTILKIKMNPRIKKDLTLECVLFYQEGGQVVMLPAEVATDRVGDLSAR